MGAVIFAPEGGPSELPPTVESYSPFDGSTVLRQIKVEIDLPTDYDVIMVIDGITIPSAELTVTPETGRFAWQPSATTIIPDWTVGFHTVWVRWDRSNGLPDPGEWTWTFRVQ